MEEGEEERHRRLSRRRLLLRRRGQHCGRRIGLREGAGPERTGGGVSGAGRVLVVEGMGLRGFATHDRKPPIIKWVLLTRDIAST